MAKWLRVQAVICVTALSAAVVAQPPSRPNENWVATWGTAEMMATTAPGGRPLLPPNLKPPAFQGGGAPRPRPNNPTDLEKQTVRMVVHTSIGGSKLRVELSNAFGKTAVNIGNAHIALRTAESSIDSKTDRQLTFSGSPSVEMTPGSVIVSDPVNLDIKPMSDIAVSIYVVKSEGQPANHVPGLHTTYVSDGDTTASPSMSEAKTNTTYMWLRSIDVVAGTPKDFAIVCLGDSITDGYATTVDANQAWPTLLAKRLSDKKAGTRISVVNEGISGNQVLHDGAGVSALARFDRDVLTVPGVRWIVLLEGINDINLRGQITGDGAVTADDLIEGYKQLIARAHMQQIKIMGATLTPDGGLWLAGPVGEATRQKVNEWIKSSGEFDAVVDFDAAVRDRDQPTRLRTEFDSKDHIHPNDVGNAAMAGAFNLAVFTK